MDNSPLSRLPRELQNLIFEYALSFSTPLVRPDSLNAVNDNDRRPSTALVQTCHEVYAETKDLVYILNTFLLRPPTNVPNDSYSLLLKEFLSQIDPRRRSRIRGVVVEVQAHAGYFGENVHGLRSIVENLSTTSFRVPVWIRPAFLKDRLANSAAELEAFWEIVQFDARCAGSSLEGVVAKIQEQMEKEECQEEYQDLFWVKRLYRQYLEIEQQLQSKDLVAAKEKDPVSAYIGMLRGVSWRLDLNPPVSE